MKAIRCRSAASSAAHAVCHRWHQLRRSALHLSILIGVTVALAGCAREPLRHLHTHFSFLAPQGPVAAAERWHFWFVVILLAVLVAGPVFLLTVWILWRYRYSNKDKHSYTPKWGNFHFAALIMWGGPVVIVVILGFFVWQNSHKLNPFKPLVSNQPALHVQAIGYDWKWLFVYPKQGIATVGVLPIPSGRPIRMQLTSNTVMQSLWIPSLVGQIYAMGGMTTELNFEANKPGRSLGMNTMYDGTGFHQQRFTTVAMAPGAFNLWIQRAKLRGVPLNAHVYKLLSERNTKSQLATALRLSPHAVRNGAFYLRDVPPELFAKILHATVHDTPVNLSKVASLPVAPAPIAAPNPTTASVTEK